MHNIFWAALLPDNSDDCMSAVFLSLLIKLLRMSIYDFISTFMINI